MRIGGSNLCEYATYRSYLLTLTICDPACGSGAFLNQALDFLIKEHHYIDELQTKLLGGSIILSDITNDILEKNIYGVDINEESVEIARLSLWLRTAKKGRALTTLNDNIKCGNSLIDDPTVAGEKAFNWEKEFPKVFEKGGFDVVVGNPPYVRQELIKPFKPYLKKTYKTFQGTADLFTYFIEISVDRLLNKNGLYSIIVANKWMLAGYGKPLRKWLKNKQLIEIIDFGDLQIFDGATTYPCIITISSPSPKNSFTGLKLKSLAFADLNHHVKRYGYQIEQNELEDDGWLLSNKESSEILMKLMKKGNPLSSILNNEVFYGIKTGFNEAFIIDEKTKDKLIDEDKRSIEVIKPFLVGKDIQRYETPPKNKYILFIPWHFPLDKDPTIKGASEKAEGAFKKQFPAVYNHLLKYKLQLSNRNKAETGVRYEWYALQRCAATYFEEFKKPKILYLVFQVKPQFTFDDNGMYINNAVWMIPTSSKYLLGFFNSKLGWFINSNICTQIQNGVQLIYKYFRRFPVVIPNSGTKKTIETLVDLILIKNHSLSEQRARFHKILKRRLCIEVLSIKLTKWDNLTFTEFTKELKKKKIKLSLSEEAEWEEYFEAEKKKALEIKAVIDKTDREIDEMVYELYGLTEEEIKIVEG